MNSENPEATSPVRKSKGPGCLVFLAIFFVTWITLTILSTWFNNGDNKVPGGFMVLVYDQTDDYLRLVRYKHLDKQIKSFKEAGIQYSFKIPENKVPHGLYARKVHYSVTNIKGGNQEIKLDYEFGMMDNPTCDYRVVKNTIQPVSYSGGGPNAFYAFFIALIVVVVIEVVRYVFIFIRWIGKITGDKKEGQG